MLNYIRLLFFVSFLLLSFHSSAQNISIAWEKEFSSLSNLYCRFESSVQTDDGVVFILANKDSIDHHLVVKLTNEGKVAWNYRIEECTEGPYFRLPYEVKIKGNIIYVLGQEKLKGMYDGECPNDPEHYFILGLDAQGKKIFHNRYEGTYKAIVIRNADIFVMSIPEKYGTIDDSLDIDVISLHGKFLKHKKIYLYNQVFVNADITSTEELIIVLGERVLKFDKKLVLEAEMEYKLEFNPEFGTKLNTLPTGEVLLAYTTYKTYKKTTSGEYSIYKLYLLNFNLSTKKHWLKVIGDSLNKDFFKQLYLEKDHFFVTYQSANPASQYYSLDTIHLLNYSYRGDLVSSTSFDFHSFGTNFKVINNDGKLKIFSVPPPIDFRKSRNEMITYTQINTEGKKASQKIPFEGHGNFKLVRQVYSIGTNEYLLFVDEPYTSSVIRIKIE